MEQSKKFCSQCGAELSEGTKFCPACGQLVEGEKTSSEKSELPSDDDLQTANHPTTKAKSEEESTEENVKSEAAQQLTKIAEQAKTSTAKFSKATNAKADEFAQVLNNKTGRNFKGIYLIVAAVVVVVVVVFGAFKFIRNQKTNVLKDVQVKYSGYNKMGEAELQGDYEKTEEAAIAKKVGYSSSDVAAVKKGNESVLSADSAKFAQVEKYFNDTKISLSKRDDLSNGNKVTVTVSTSLQDNPIKAGKKIFKVSGLKKSTTYTFKDLIKDDKITFSGYNHFGTVSYDEDIYNAPYDDQASDLSNGDTLKFSVSDSYIENQEEKGKIFEGNKTQNIKVTGLEDSPKISNLSDLLSQTDALVKKEYQSSNYDKYTVTRQDSYFIGTDVEGSNGWYSDDSSDLDNTFSVLTIYKVDDKPEYGDPSTRYYVYGYENLSPSSGKVNVAALKDDDEVIEMYNSENSADDVLNSIKADYPSLVKLN